MKLWMLRECGCSVWLTQHGILEFIQEGDALRVACILHIGKEAMMSPASSSCAACKALVAKAMSAGLPLKAELATLHTLPERPALWPNNARKRDVS